jgi:hypothetical protein
VTVHPQADSHVEITESHRHGDDFQFDGAVILATDPTRVRQQVSIAASVHGDLATLVLNMGGESFR